MGIESGDAPVRMPFPDANSASLSDGSSTCATNSILSFIAIAPTTALGGSKRLGGVFVITRCLRPGVPNEGHQSSIKR
jgi:hypothetical protein